MKQQLGSALALDLVANKWFVMIVHQLQRATKRYSELKRDIPGGISQRMLTHTLRGMERDGLVNRVVYPVVPPRTEYSLTPLGRTLIKPLHTLCVWAEEYFDEVLENRRRRERRPVSLVLKQSARRV
jgi:DNA-binding HxlR family transcriptional regulator